MDWKPDGYPSVSPYLIVCDAEAVLQFLEAAFAARRLRIVPREGGRGLMHAEAAIEGGGVVMMGEQPEAVPTHVHVYVPDARATFDRALAAGGTEVQALTDNGDGDLRGGIDDGLGTVWWISTQLRG